MKRFRPPRQGHAMWTRSARWRHGYGCNLQAPRDPRRALALPAPHLTVSPPNSTSSSPAGFVSRLAQAPDASSQPPAGPPTLDAAICFAAAVAIVTHTNHRRCGTIFTQTNHLHAYFPGAGWLSPRATVYTPANMALHGEGRPQPAPSTASSCTIAEQPSSIPE
jgi:hypothetical protein